MDQIFLSLSIPIQIQLLKDLLTTCYEGGSAYWLGCYNVNRDDDKNVILIHGCYDIEDQSEKFADIDLETMIIGIHKILEGKVKIADRIRNDVLSTVTDPDSTAWDAETADCILQAGLFGEIVYG